MTLGVFWLIMSFARKRTMKRQGLLGRLTHVLFGAIAYVLFVEKPFGSGALAARFVPAVRGLAIGGSVLTWAGVAIAAWARIVLGRNWSALPTIKQDHTLVRSGPYAVVRHPIYSGLLVAGLGTALVVGEVRGLLGVALMFVGWLLKSRAEERMLMEQFGNEYEQYRRDTWALVPFVL
jgi:protein-S-isoprenylcysteine O-methyltransferase